MKVNLLALDTSSNVSSVALIKESQYHFYASGSGERQHTQQILPQIQTVLFEANLSLSQLHALAFSAGPGSFTGIRLAATLAQGLAFGANLPIIPISTLQTIAQETYKSIQLEGTGFVSSSLNTKPGGFLRGKRFISPLNSIGTARPPNTSRGFLRDNASTETPIWKVERYTTQGATHVAVAINAFAEKIYWGIYQCIAGEMQPLSPDTLCSPQEATLPPLSVPWVGAGNAWDLYANQLQHLPMQSVYTDTHADAKSVARLAMTPYLAGKCMPPTQALPVYLYGADCWKKLTTP